MQRSPGIILAWLGAFLLCVAPAGAQEVPSQEFRALVRAALNEPHEFRDEYDAEVWLKDMSLRLAKRAPHVSEKERFEVLRLVHREAQLADLDPHVVLALIEVESNFDHYAISSAGARGLMQVMPFWIDEIGQESDNLFDMETNIRYGCTILSLYLKKERHNLTHALARYNGSRGKVWYPDRVFRALKNRWAP